MRRPHLRSASSLCLIAFSLTILQAAGLYAGDDVTWFRRDHGLAPEGMMLPTEFGEGADRLWRVELPPGISTPCLCGDSIFVTTYVAESKELATIALDRTTGQVRWKQVAPVKTLEAFHAVGSPAASTPACNGSQVFSFFGSHGLLCYDLNGNLLWERPMGPFQDEFGASSSPVLVGDKVVLNEDHDIDSFLIALDQTTGEVAWKTAREEATRSYATPVVFDNQGRTEILVAGSRQLAAYDPNDGKKLWWFDGLSRIVDSTPVVVNGEIYFATWTPGGDSDDRIRMEPFSTALTSFDKNSDGEIGKDELPEGSPILERFFRIDLSQNQRLNQQEWEKHALVFERAQNIAAAIRPGTDGPVPAENVNWKYQRSLPTVPSSVVYDGVLYMVKDGGILTSLDASSGEALKQARLPGGGSYYASVVAGDGKVYLISEDGVITILKAGRDWSILGSHDLQERVLATPVIADGLMLIRTDNALYAFRCR
ncbi:MAG: PQQ-binding-like beta-propeller repeat protein [Fuerstia sp.]|nr:PQQ-binding-like beta-propeller repeat protein [Fuerstiella sp.]